MGWFGSKAGKVVMGVVLLFVVVLIALVFLSRNKSSGSGSSGGLPVVKTKEVQGSLVEGFPANIPVYDGAKLVSSYVGAQGLQKVYGANWEISEVNGHSPDKASTREVGHWYEDDALPMSWLFDEPLQQSGDATNPSKEWLTVSKDGWVVTFVVEQKLPTSPVEVTILAKQK